MSLDGKGLWSLIFSATLSVLPSCFDIELNLEDISAEFY